MNMRKLTSLVIASVLGGIIALGGYKLFLEEETQIAGMATTPTGSFIRTTFNQGIASEGLTDFTVAANETVHAVVHVKNVTTARQPRNLREYYYGGGEKRKLLQGTGSGVIITPDGYIVTNNHVIEGATEIQVTLNNNKTYTAKIVGSDPETDIALLKIEAEDLDYVPFGDSENIQIGQWVLAVGNPFNLTSTVTAGIISAKARDLNRTDQVFQSFIQTDAAINAGNSGGALVNTNGQLIGINTAITSQTGSYIGYSFAVPSNTVRKVVEDILEYGDVQEAILGVRGTVMNSSLAENFDLGISQGFYVGGVDAESGAQKAGLREGDVILKVDQVRITKFADLTGYLTTKRPKDIVDITYLRDGEQKETKVTLKEYKSFAIQEIGLEVTNASKEELAEHQATYGVKISRALNPTMKAENLIGIIITEINGQPVRNVDEVKAALRETNPQDPMSITFAGTNGEERTFIFR